MVTRKLAAALMMAGASGVANCDVNEEAGAAFLWCAGYCQFLATELPENSPDRTQWLQRRFAMVQIGANYLSKAGYEDLTNGNLGRLVHDFSREIRDMYPTDQVQGALQCEPHVRAADQLCANPEFTCYPRK